MSVIVTATRDQVRFVCLWFGEGDSDYVACRGKENPLF